MANGAPRSPGALSRRARAEAAEANAPAEGFNADTRAAEREALPIVVGGRTFKRVRKDWEVSRAMRKFMRTQEREVARNNRLGRRIGELEAEQTEAARTGQTERETELEELIDGLVEDADEATEIAEWVTYRLLSLLMVIGDDGEQIAGFGPEHVDDDAEAAVKFLQRALDVEDAGAMARELTGSQEPDPQTTPSSGTGSS